MVATVCCSKQIQPFQPFFSKKYSPLPLHCPHPSLSYTLNLFHMAPVTSWHSHIWLATSCSDVLTSTMRSFMDPALNWSNLPRWVSPCGCSQMLICHPNSVLLPALRGQLAMCPWGRVGEGAHHCDHCPPPWLLYFLSPRLPPAHFLLFLFMLL